MIHVTNKFKENIVKPRMIDAKINYDDIELTAEDDINHIERIFDAGIFKTCMKGLNIDINRTIEEKKIIKVKAGIYVDDSFEYVALGEYKTHEAKRNEDTDSYQIESYDKVEESMIDYDLSVEYPISVRDMFLKIFERLNWDTSYIPTGFVNSDKLINQDVWSNINYTFRDCLDELCTISCQWLVEKDGNVILTQPNLNDQILDEEYFSDSNVEIGHLVSYNALIFSRVGEADNIDRKDEESIEKNGLRAFKVVENQILSTDDRSNFIDEMWNYIKNFKYYSFDCESNGIMFLEPLDKIQIKLSDITYDVIILKDVLDITSDINELISAEASEESESNIKYSTDTDKKSNMASMHVDKQNKKIEALAKDVSDVKKLSSEFTIRADSIESSVSDIQQNVDSNNEEITNLKQQVTNVQTSTSQQFTIIEEKIENGVETLKNALVTIDINGIHVSMNESKISMLITNNQFAIVNDQGVNLAFFGYNEEENRSISEMDNLTVTNFFTAGAHRQEKFVDPDTGEVRTGWAYTEVDA